MSDIMIIITYNTRTECRSSKFLICRTNKLKVLNRFEQQICDYHILLTEEEALEHVNIWADALVT